MLVLWYFNSLLSGTCSNVGHGIQKEWYTGAHFVYSLLLITVNLNMVYHNIHLISPLSLYQVHPLALRTLVVQYNES